MKTPGRGPASQIRPQEIHRLARPRAAETRKRTRIQQENEDRILDAALEVFSVHGFRGSTIDQIATAAGMSKPNLLYYFRTKEAIHRLLIAVPWVILSQRGTPDRSKLNVEAG